MSSRTKLITSVAVLVLVVFGAGYWYLSHNDSTDVVENDTTVSSGEDVSQSEETTFVYRAEGVLDDVTGNEVSSGLASATYDNKSNYKLLAEFKNLPELQEGFFYEGWLVNKDTSDFFSTGEATQTNGQYSNTYTSQQDHLTDGYSFYVLTLEPDDGDPAPADHIVEGFMKLVN